MKYYSTSYVRMGQVQSGVLYLSYRSDPVITKAEHCKAYPFCSSSILSFLSVKHNSKTIGQIRIFYIYRFNNELEVSTLFATQGQSPMVANSVETDKAALNMFKPLSN